MIEDYFNGSGNFIKGGSIRAQYLGIMYETAHLVNGLLVLEFIIFVYVLSACRKNIVIKKNGTLHGVKLSFV